MKAPLRFVESRLVWNLIMADTPNEQLITWLQEQGHTPAEVDKIMAKVAEYDAQTLHESIFDSISSGTIDIEKIVREALGEG
jgi:hypothetical protein